MTRYYDHKGPFPLEMGGALPELRIAYHTWGEFRGDNVIWICHALTANSDVADWWPHMIEAGKFLDPEKYFIVCANFLGSCYGTTGPSSENPATGKPYLQDFPKYTIRDMVEAHRLLAKHLGIGRIQKLMGPSVGGFQALEWAVTEPERFDQLIVIASEAEASPWTIALDETQRMAIRSDSTFGAPDLGAGKAGLATARAIGLLSYRGAHGYNLTQQDIPCHSLDTPHRACTYQQYQGKKLVDRFDVYSYISILDAFDTHSVGRGRGGIPEALARIAAKTLIVGISTDIIFLPSYLKELTAMIPGATYAEMDSEFCHDGFLVEHGKINKIMMDAEKNWEQQNTQRDE